MVSDGYQSPGRRQRSFNRRRHVVYGVRNAKLGRPRAHYRRDIIIVVRQADHTQKHTNTHARKTTHTPTRTATHTNARARAPVKRRSVRGRVAEWGRTAVRSRVRMRNDKNLRPPLHTCTSTARELRWCAPADAREYHSRLALQLQSPWPPHPPPQKSTLRYHAVRVACVRPTARISAHLSSFSRFSIARCRQ
ncbi:unnamed protein product [Aphis gossypii]|uniref:Uncharacterized protein n=1 Tax=Aphis gossypii TaxID=80765 RepID=A0A9P0J0I8_APHGO|nr:unnamed protein product [Aphis gossypii]